MKVSGTQLAEVLGLHKSRVSQLKTERIIETDPDGKFDLAKSVQAYIAYLETGPASAEVAAHRARLIEQQTRRLKLANDKESKGLMSTEAVRFVVTSAMSTAVQELEAIPSRMAGVLAGITDPALIRDHLKAEVHSVRRRMGERFDALAAEVEQA